jgi:hypothetical protein
MRFNAVVRIQRFWRKIRQEFVQNKIKQRSKQTQKQVIEPNQYDHIDGILDHVSIVMPLTQSNRMGRTFINSETNELTQYQESKLLGLFKGWKVRRILRNQHLKGLKNEVGFMLKHKQNDLDDQELKHCKAEFIRIARKFCDIFNRLWKNHEWIKKHNTVRGREISQNRSPRDFNSSVKISNHFNPVFEQSKSREDLKKLNRNHSKISPKNKAPDRINMFAEMEIKNTNNRKRDHSTPSMKISNNLVNSNRQYAMQDQTLKNHSDGLAENVNTQRYIQKNIQPSPQSQPISHPQYASQPQHASQPQYASQPQHTSLPQHISQPQMLQGQPQYMPQMYPGYAQYPNYQVPYGYHPPIGMPQAYYAPMYPYQQPMPAQIPGHNQPIYFVYPHPSQTENATTPEVPSVIAPSIKNIVPIQTQEKVDIKPILPQLETEIFHKYEEKKINNAKPEELSLT